MRYFRQLIILFALLMLSGCEDTAYHGSSVPFAAVRISIDTELGTFSLFQPTSWTDYVIVDREGFHYHGNIVLPLGMNMHGYGGVVVYVGMNGYDAWDLACPYCASRGAVSPCTIDGIYAVCPVCGEQYNLANSTGAPQKGLIREALKKYKCTYLAPKITVTN